jgi:hypothetical protein
MMIDWYPDRKEKGGPTGRLSCFGTDVRT